MTRLSFVTPLAYDWKWAPGAIESYYPIADEIILGLDRDRLTWSRNPFEIDLDALKTSLARIDVQGKIRIAEGDFHCHDHPMRNETLERSKLSLRCIPDNWIVQIDADERLLNATHFAEWMGLAPNDDCLWARMLTVFKSFGNRALVIEPADEFVPVATRRHGEYTAARATAQNNSGCPLLLLHYSWAREPEELKQKLANWGHARDFDTEAYFKFWESVTLENYQQLKNFHPIHPASWPALVLKEMPSGRDSAPADSR
ncbi:MAG: hypothetical protein ABSF29_13755 [Tepidisphaeraceae bacterium]|jgi:hypothetical protein